MAAVLLEEVGPNGNIQAVVEVDEDVCFFYLFGAQETDFGMRSVWVRNHSQAPDSLDVARMRSGIPPRNPKGHCRHPQGLLPPSKDQLRVVWLPEGNGAALYESDELLAIIPPWSGMNGFHGYARDSIGEGPVAWEIGTDNALIGRFREAQSYWRQWADANPWPLMQDALLSGIERTLGRHTNYYAIDGGQWPPKAIVRIPRPDSVVLVTIGVSVRPQPQVEMATEQPELRRRIELGVVLPARWSDDGVKRFASYMSGQSRLPWDGYTWLGPGHTITCDAWQNRSFAFALLRPDHPAVPTPTLEPQFHDPVKILWFVPISTAERQTAMDHGSDRLMQALPLRRWEQA
jgi:Suppressor of fused protein (SUFU)